MTARPVNPNLTAALEDYLARRRALGFGLIEEERHARRFLEWLWVGGHIRASFTATQAVTWARGDGSFARSYPNSSNNEMKFIVRKTGESRKNRSDEGSPAHNALGAKRAEERRQHRIEQAGTSYAQTGVRQKLGLAVGRDCGITGNKGKR